MLSPFPLLEFLTHAHSNVPNATLSTFLFNNGIQYHIAHTVSALECLVSALYFPHWQDAYSSPRIRLLGAAILAVGQVVRSVAMAQAGTNFNHKVQSRRAAGHVLVSEGIYAWLRHPSYFGFFWWAVGSQVMVGNKVCLVVYCVMLHRFFAHRIMRKLAFVLWLSFSPCLVSLSEKGWNVWCFVDGGNADVVRACR